MPVNLPLPDLATLTPVKGVRLGVAKAHIRKPDRKDVLLLALAEGATAAGVFTKNRFCAAPVQVSQKHLLATGGAIKALVINTGCANAGTGARGLEDAVQTCEAVADALGCTPSAVLPFSTGVILEPLPMERLLSGVTQAAAALGGANWLDAAQAIMTTDTQPKAHSVTAMINGQPVVLTGISKGAGMIRPNMATMLGFVACDAKIPAELLSQMTRNAADCSFNRITIDGDTSTNDSFIVMATGQGSVAINEQDSLACAQMQAALNEICQFLAQAIVRDGEGATKFISIFVEGGRNADEVAKVGYAIAHSPLVKTAFFASDPNLGRILAAIGYAGVDDLDVNNISLWLDEVLVAEKGGRATTYQEADGQRIMQQSEILIRVALNRGAASTTVWTCDLSHDYVSINADYRS